MRVTTRMGDDATAYLHLTGELDLATADVLDEHVHRAVAGDPRHLVVDLADVTFCDSSGIEALLTAQATSARQGIDLRVVNPGGVTLRAFQLTGVLEVLTAADDSPPARVIMAAVHGRVRTATLLP